MPFLVLAVWRWDRFPSRAVPWLPAWVGPVSLGVACSVKQTPWFCVPFLVVGVALEARRAGGRPVATGLRYAALVAGSFLASTWRSSSGPRRPGSRGTFLPLVQPLVADGQGVVTLALHGLTGGVVLPWLAAAAGLVLSPCCPPSPGWRPRLKRAWLFLVPLALFLPDRSLANYLLDLVPAALVAALSVRAVGPGPGAGGPAAGDAPGCRGLAVGVPAVVTVVLLVVAFSSAPLADHRRPRHGRRGGHRRRRAALRRRSTSPSATAADRPLLPRFMVSSGGGHPGGFWRSTAVRGESPVPPGATTRYVLRPPRFTRAPDHGARWLVEAYTTSPDALSTSPLQYWSPGTVGH